MPQDPIRFLIEVYRPGRAQARGYDRLVVEEGKPAPEFELTSDAGERIRLSSLRGKPVVLYFYPKDDSPCTIRRHGSQEASPSRDRRRPRLARRRPRGRAVPLAA